MKKLLFLFLSLFALGSIFQACDDSKTYAEMLEDEKNAVNKFISDSAIHIISQEVFEKQDSTTAVKGVNGASYDEFVAFSNGVYMQIVDRGVEDEADVFADNDIICVRYLEKNVATRELTSFNVFLEEYALPQYYVNPAVFRYVNNESTYVAAGTFLEMDYLWESNYQSTVVPQGWLLALPYLRNNAHIRLIIPSKMGHNTAQQYVTPYYYDIRKLSKALS